MTPTLVVAIIVIALGGLALYRSVQIVPQATADVVERLGRYHRTLNAGLNTIVPFIDKIRLRIDLREQVISFQPQPVITEDNLVVHIDTVIYYQVIDPRAATYEIAQFITAIEQLTVTTLRNVIGGMDLERTLTSREEINTELRGVLDDATGRWGIRVNRVELKAIEPPASITDAMEKQMRADRDKRAAILSAEGQKQAAILTAEGERTAAVLRARGEAEATVLRAEAESKSQAVRSQGQAQAITTVTRAIQEGNVDQRVLAYQYLQFLPELARGDANKVWFVPSELGRALDSVGGLFNPDRQPTGREPGPAPDVPEVQAPPRPRTPDLAPAASARSTPMPPDHPAEETHAYATGATEPDAYTSRAQPDPSAAYSSQASPAQSGNAGQAGPAQARNAGQPGPAQAGNAGRPGQPGSAQAEPGRHRGSEPNGSSAAEETRAAETRVGAHTGGGLSLTPPPPPDNEQPFTAPDDDEPPFLPYRP
jgi:regulator of protease activity HflC (stomatin/prohibitin superfamily)